MTESTDSDKNVVHDFLLNYDRFAGVHLCCFEQWAFVFSTNYRMFDILKIVSLVADET